MRIGTAVIVVPLHQPLLVAEEIATLDVVSGGRADVGLGRGYQQYEFQRFGYELDEGRKRWDECIDIIFKALEGKPFTYEGKYFRLPETCVFPQPLQKPHPPVWITAQSPYAVEAAVKRGFNVLTGGFGVPVSQLADYGRLFDKVVADVKPKQKPRISVQRPVYVTDNDADVRDAVEHARWNMRVTLSLRHQKERVEKGIAIPIPGQAEPAIDELLENMFVIGTPDECIRQIKRLQKEVGITHFNCNFWFGDMEQKRVLRSMERFSKEVMPAIS
jgi:alkanesulfonate monooxygenase SsuD/methylene tetrahydromethanopterin reductase-like flavin-dependent oxidoreductase (luciferase family)